MKVRAFSTCLEKMFYALVQASVARTWCVFQYARTKLAKPWGCSRPSIGTACVVYTCCMMKSVMHSPNVIWCIRCEYTSVSTHVCIHSFICFYVYAHMLQSPCWQNATRPHFSPRGTLCRTQDDPNALLHSLSLSLSLLALTPSTHS